MGENGTNGAPTGDIPDEAPPVSPEVAELQSQLEIQAARLDEVLRAYSRLQQEREEFRKRSEREKERVLEVERGNVALALLEAVDELDRTLSSVPKGQPSPLVSGVRLIRDGLLRRALTSGIQRYETIGQPFDPSLHEASDIVEVDDPGLDERVIEEVRAGYRQGDRVLRAARVRVGRFSGELGPNGSGGSIGGE
jgi:molecular chaperone GrpE